ncbi:MAG: hypothetical protein A3H68_03280 [Candidatus Taylorbacteria bacterium RIFCSPLOWO2_02_FULL_46_40]|uniref:Uncharacterized protein n=1 Tax=Candidatus Taylorbacteria bacterium RIFCSPLOWO2_02_FULL_46_40 TaxID=1802329 RepID=A0A1G2P309_9BACT|nr:MAG: hypothetical protein A3H68_03280 [Candidatus Taylorbacteria bacterium RIFCSPLOWO2_02_FULL_46_40]
MGHSAYRKFIVLNFAYGTGPYLRCLDLALAFNQELQVRGRERLGIIVPWVYGEKQKSIICQEFFAHDKRYPGEILFDRRLGSILKSVFYSGSKYEKVLEKWASNVRVISAKANRHLSGVLDLETIIGEKVRIKGENIVVELSRSPRIRYEVAPAYFTSFGYLGEILERSRNVRKGLIDVKPSLLKEGSKAADWVEGSYRLHCLSYPATFTSLNLSLGDDSKRYYKDEIIVPPIGPTPKLNEKIIAPGIFVTISGVSGLKRLYKEAKKLGVAIYSNDVKSALGSIRSLPDLISNNNIIFQFARAGWSSVWLSMIVGTPLVVPSFDPKDDPEIYWNNKAVEELGIGIVYRGQCFDKLMGQVVGIRRKQVAIKERILKKWGTLNGLVVCAKIFVDDFLRGEL